MLKQGMECIENTRHGVRLSAIINESKETTVYWSLTMHDSDKNHHKAHALS